MFTSGFPFWTHNQSSWISQESQRRQREAVELGRSEAAGWVEGSRAAGSPSGSGSSREWMKYVRTPSATSTQPNQHHHNLMALQVHDQVYYKAMRDIEPAEEMLLYVRDAVYPEKQLESLQSSVPGEDQQQQSYPCDKCGELFRSKVALRRHETYVCHNANAIFSTINRQFKERQHHESTNHQDNSTSSDEDRSQTMIETVKAEEKLFSDKLNQDFGSEGESDIDGLKQFPCENCDKVFTDPSNLQRHIRSQHVGARSHACTDCGKTFATSSGLKQHQHIHSSVKPFQCEVCLKAYTQFSNLCRHKRMHADCRQQIKCKDCGQAFSTMTSLSKHKRFCEGMLRNASRFSFPSPTEKSSSPHMSPTSPAISALASTYMNIYAHRPPFPFYPPPPFPVFPAGHAMGMPPSLMPDGAFPTGPMAPKLTPSESALTPEGKRDGSEFSDSSDISSTSDLDTTGSDLDSEHGSDRKTDKSHSPGPMSSIRTSTPVKQEQVDIDVEDVAPRKEATPPPPAGRKSPASTTSKNSSSCKQELPCDLSKANPSSSPRVKTEADLPLDLSVKSKDEEDTPRKTHIFGDRKSDGVKPKSTPVEKPKDHLKEVIRPEIPSPPKDREPSQPVFPTREPTAVHSAFPIPSNLMMDPMYRVSKEKLQSLHESRMHSLQMAFGPRIPMHGQHFHPMMQMHPSFMAHRDPTKLPSHLLGKAPEGPFPHPHPQFPHPNKLKERYACKFCGKIFPRSANLTRHLRTHTGEQPYKCKYCERSFSISSNLQRHVRNIHNKEKPFKCPLCDRCFGQQTNLDRHLKKHESEGPNFVDSPPPGQTEPEGLHDKEDSYFDEIRNFIDKTTTDSRERDTTPIKDYDTNFSITAQMEKHSQIYAAGEKRPRTAEDDGEQPGDEGDSRLGKKACLDNNNDMDVPLSKTASADLNSSSVSNGFHDSEEEVEEAEQKAEEDTLHSTFKPASSIGLTKNGITAPLALST